MMYDRPTKQAITAESDITVSIMETLRYFHMFNHVLYEHELHRFLGAALTPGKLHGVLQEMVRDEKIFYYCNMYALEDSSKLFLKRLIGADMAVEKMREARAVAKVIAFFPFVRGIYISGSLSKGYADECSDIDFFIVTAPRRLWICRTLLHVFKKLTFLVNKQHSFCMNYFIDESRLCLEEQNIFTATELASLVPVLNMDLYHRILGANKEWMENMLPNVVYQREVIKTASKMNKLRKWMEWLFNKLWPDALNTSLMKLTDKRWRKKWQKKNYPMKDYDLAMKTRWYVSKQHPLNYQKKVLEYNKGNACA